MSIAPLLSDETLVERALSGSSRSIEELVLRYQRKAYAVARAIVLDADAGHDIVQQSLLLALEHLSSLRVRSRFGPWFLQIVRNVARRSIASRADRGREVTSATEPAGADEDELEGEEFRECVWEHVRDLPLPVREAILLYYYEGESVREVARALDTSTAAVKKRLQKGRDLLRAGLWRELRDVLRDLLPSTRQWKRNGRRHALVVVGALSTAAAPVAPSAAAVGEAVSTLSIGGIVMAKKAMLAAVVLLVLISVTVLNWPDRDNSAGDSSKGDVAAGSAFVAREDFDRLSTELEAERNKLASALRENDTLARELGLAKAKIEKIADGQEASGSNQSNGDASVSAEKDGLGIDWSKLSKLMAESGDLIALIGETNRRPVRAEDQAQLMKLMSELLRISAQANGIVDHPIFHQDLLPELSSALFAGSLGLDEEQAAGLADLARRALDDVVGEADPDTLLPLERYRLRQQVSERLRDGIAELLDEEQAAKWQPLDNFAEQLFRGGVEIRRYGIDRGDLVGEVETDWRQSFSLREEQQGWANEFAQSYVEDARKVLQQYGENQGELSALEPDRQQHLERSLMDLQRRYEQRIQERLDDGQLDALRATTPRVLRFDFGQNRNVTNVGRMF